MNLILFCTACKAIVSKHLFYATSNLLMQVNSAFVWAVAQAAEKVMDGFVDPVNGSQDDPAFLCGGVFMSLPVHREEWLGGERGHRAAQRLELRSVQVQLCNMMVSDCELFKYHKNTLKYCCVVESFVCLFVFVFFSFICFCFICLFCSFCFLFDFVSLVLFHFFVCFCFVSFVLFPLFV